MSHSKREEDAIKKKHNKQENKSCYVKMLHKFAYENSESCHHAKFIKQVACLK